MHRVLRLFIFLTLIFVVSPLGFSQDFSAEMFDLRPGRTDTVKIFVEGSKVRMEPQGKGKDSQIMIWDTAGQKSYVLAPARHMYMEIGSSMLQRAINLWRPADVEDACTDWLKVSQQLNPGEKPATCRKVGNDIVNGRSAVKYEGTSPDGKKGEVWLDVKVRYLVKVVSPDGGGMELRNIHEGSSDASLFEVPPGYKNMDAGSTKRSSRPPH
jgi:hypothetical protein